MSTPAVWQPMEDRDGIIWMDGKLVPWREAKIHLLTHGLHYASCVWEGVRSYKGVIFKNHEHNERLERSAEALNMRMPYTVEEMDAACEMILRENNLQDAYFRPVVWRGAEATRVSPQHTKVHAAIAVWQMPDRFDAKLWEKGVRLIHTPWRRPAPDSAPSHAKAAGVYMICTMSKEMAENAGADDALMLDYRGQVAEATASNIFLVKDGKLITPLADCFLNGITRLTVIELARARGVEVIERAVWPDELKTADEVFLTGTAAEITAVGQIGDDCHYKVGPVTRRIHEEYAALVRGVPYSAAAE